jgi:hypothetical protein
MPSNARPRFLPRLEYFGLADAFMATLGAVPGKAS